MSHLKHQATIKKYSHYFSIKHPTPAVAKVIYALSAEYTQHALQFDKKLRRKRWLPYKTFGLYIDHGREFRFHIGQFEEFMRLLNQHFVPPSSYEIIEEEMYEPARVELEVREEFKLYENQEEASTFVIEGGVSPLLLMPTGTGKGPTSIISTARLGYRFAVRVQAMYVEKWVKEIQEVLYISRDEICVIQGSDILQRATNFPGSGLPMPKVFVISISTMSSWCKLYEEDINNPKLEAYACLPSDFCKHLGIGTEIYDEAHLHPHAVYRNMVFTHVPKTIILTATLLTKDPVLRRVQSAMFPRVGRFEKIKMKKYITAHACSYQIINFPGSKIQTSEHGQTSYSHPAFEKSIIRQPKILRQYLKMISDLALRTYFVDKQPTDTMLVFVATKKMAQIVHAHFRSLWPKLDIRQYLQENDFKDILEPDICITTIISGGTAIDKKDLRHVINTISIDSPNANAQVLGRLREMKHRTEHNDVHFHYLYCSSIPKQVEYHRNKIELLQERVKEIKNVLLDAIFP